MSKLLVVVDYQNDFVDGSLGFPGAEKLDEGIAEKVLTHQGPVIYTLDTHPAEYLNTREGKALPVEHCIRKSEGWEPYGKTKEALDKVNATAVEKKSFGISPKTIESMDLPESFDEIELAGLVTNICVISNAVIFQAAYPEAQIVVDASLCASFDPVLHDKTLDVLAGLQVKIINR